MPGDILVLLSDGIYEYHDAGGEQFGEAAGRGDRPVAATASRWRELSAILLDAVQAFARGAPQEDDITVVLVKREAGGARPIGRSGAASTRSRRIFAFTAAISFADHGDRSRAAADRRFRSGRVVHEHGQVQPHERAPPCASTCAGSMGACEVTLTDYDVEPFDVTQAPDADIDLPIEQRKPGGLGLHLIRRLVDSHRVRVFNGDPAEPDHVPQDAGRAAGLRGRSEQRGRACSRLISARMTSVVIAGRLDAAQCRGRPGLSRPGPGHGDPGLQRAGVHFQRRPGGAAEDPEAAAGGGRQASAVRASTAICGTSSGIRASTRSSRSNPPADPRPNFPDRRV